MRDEYYVLVTDESVEKLPGNTVGTRLVFTKTFLETASDATIANTLKAAFQSIDNYHA